MNQLRDVTAPKQPAGLYRVTHEQHAVAFLHNRDRAGILCRIAGSFITTPSVGDYLGGLFDLLYLRGVASDTLIAWQSIADGITEDHWRQCSARMLSGAWGEFFFHQKLLEMALLVNRVALDRDNTSAMAHANYGTILSLTGRAANAEAHFVKAIDCDPQYFEAHVNYGDWLYKAGRIVEAEEQWRQAIRLNPGAPIVHLALSHLLENADRLVEAEAHCREAIRLDPWYAEAHFQLANSLMLKQRTTEAERHYVQAIRLKPKDADARFAFALSLAAVERYADAAEQYQVILASGDNCGSVHFHYGCCLESQEQLHEAVLQFRKAAETLKANEKGKATTEVEIQHHLGRVLVRLDQVEGTDSHSDEARDILTRVVEDMRHDQAPSVWATAQSDLGSALLHLGTIRHDATHLRDAVAAFRLALEERSRDQSPDELAGIYNNLGTALTNWDEVEGGVSRYPEAIGFLERALELRLEEGESLKYAVVKRNLGAALQQSGAKNKDVAVIERSIHVLQDASVVLSLASHPMDWAGLQFQIGMSFAMMGDLKGEWSCYEQGADALRKVVDVYKDKPRFQVWLTAAQNNLAAILVVMSEQGERSSLLKEAVVMMREAISGYANQGDEPKQVMAQQSLGGLLTSIGVDENNVEYLRQAINTFDAALLISIEKEWLPVSTTLRIGLARAWKELAMRQEGTREIATAVDVYREAMSAAKSLGAPEEMIRWIGNEIDGAEAVLAHRSRQDEKSNEAE